MKTHGILGGMTLCNHCLEREGFRTKVNQASNMCDLCGGSIDGVRSMTRGIADKLREYEFDTFLVGASIDHSILEKEDELRAFLKIRGVESIKSQITKMISSRLVKLTGKRIDYSLPDLTILVSISEKTFTISSRSTWISARYRKLKRGISQRGSVCEICNGLGCARCNFLGKDKYSIQAILTDFLVSSFGGESCNFVWVGGEDQNSLVTGSGRPFLAEIIRPRRRELPLMISGRDFIFRSQELEVFNLEFLDHKAMNVPQFEVSAVIHFEVKEGGISLTADQFCQIEALFQDTYVDVSSSKKHRTVRKLIRSLKFKKTNDEDKLDLIINCDGGIPLKKFVTGQDNSVRPNLSGYLNNYGMIPEKPFDILDVKTRIPDSKNRSPNPGGHDMEIEIMSTPFETSSKILPEIC